MSICIECEKVLDDEIDQWGKHYKKVCDDCAAKSFKGLFGSEEEKQ